MNTSDMIRELCKKKDISIAELARQLGQSPQNFNKKLMRDTVSTDEMIMIADKLGVSYEQSFTFDDGDKIAILSEDRN